MNKKIKKKTRNQQKSWRQLYFICVSGQLKLSKSISCSDPLDKLRTFNTYLK